MDKLVIETKHMEMIKYAKGRIDNIPKKERVLTDMMRERIYKAWDLIGFQRWSSNRLSLLRDLDWQLQSLLRLIRLANDLGYFKGAPDETGDTKAYKIWAGMIVEEGKIVGKMIQAAKQQKGHN